MLRGLRGRVVKVLQLARPTLPSIPSRAPHKSYLPAPEHDHDEVEEVPTSLSSVAEGDLGHGRVRVVHADMSRGGAPPRITCHVV